MSVTEAQKRYLAEIPDSLPGRRAMTPPHKRMYRKLERQGLIVAARYADGLKLFETAYFIRTDAGRAALPTPPSSLTGE
ncbi:hypothetical protein FHR70_003703 [Microvirga lupini]|uniref:Uncharacterized protein n=1 Tax=Microvirga lupini TaxID=420324 RepID=A0A7W4YXI7_9HYPH|nr:hypothetical protein [Microvirga lupini]MBB3020617.1 hypothetical protein [Microvirga lupini]